MHKEVWIWPCLSYRMWPFSNKSENTAMMFRKITTNLLGFTEEQKKCMYQNMFQSNAFKWCFFTSAHQSANNSSNTACVTLLPVFSICKCDLRLSRIHVAHAFKFTDNMNNHTIRLAGLWVFSFSSYKVKSTIINSFQCGGMFFISLLPFGRLTFSL